MAQQFIGSDGTYIDPEVFAAARLASNNAQRYRQDSRGLGGLLGSLAAKIGDVGKAVYGTIGGGVASFKDLLESGGANQNNLKAFTNSLYGTNNYKDATAKQLGTSINAADTLTDFVPGVAVVKATPLGGAVAGGISGFGNTLKYEGADLDWNDAGNAIASGAITGAATAGLNNKLNGATSGIGKKIAGNALARGATSGALGGAIGAGVSGALNQQDLGTILGNMASNAASGAVTGAAMSGISQLGTKAKNAALGKFWGQTPDQVANTIAQADQLRLQDIADDGRNNNSIPALKAQTETAEETTTSPLEETAKPGKVKYMNESVGKQPSVTGGERPIEDMTYKELMNEMVNTDDDDRAIEIARQLGVPTGAKKATARDLYYTALNSEDPDQAIAAAKALGVDVGDNGYYQDLQAEERSAMNPQYADAEDEWNQNNFAHDDEGRPIAKTKYMNESTGKKASVYGDIPYEDLESKIIANRDKLRNTTDAATKRQLINENAEMQMEMDSRWNEKGNYKPAQAESLEGSLGKQAKNMTKAQIIDDLIDTGGAAGYSESQLKRMTKSQLLELADIQSSETPTEFQIKAALNDAMKKGQLGHDIGERDDILINPEADKLMELQQDAKDKNAVLKRMRDEGASVGPGYASAQRDWSKADKEYRDQLIKMVKASDKYDAATKKEMIADIKDPFEGYHDRALTRLANQLAKEASAEPTATPSATPQATATANTLKKFGDIDLADKFAEIENTDEITSDDYVLMNQIADEVERRGNSKRADSMRELAGRAVSRRGTTQENPYALAKDQRPKNADDWEHVLTNGQVNGRTLAAKMDYGFTDDDLKNIAEVYQRNGNARKTIDDMLTDANFHGDQEIMEKRAALADAERAYKARTGRESNGGYKEMLEPAKKRKVVEGPAYPDDIMNMKINRGEWGEPTGNEDYTEPTNERYSLNTDDDQGVKPRPDLYNEDIEVPDYTKPVDREGNTIKIEKRNWLQGAGEKFSRAGDRIENQDIYNALYSKTADRAIREGTVDTLKRLGYGPQDYGEAAKVSTAVNQMVDNMVENSRAKINDPDLIDNLRNIANDDSVVLSPAQEKKLNQQIRAVTENLGQGDMPYTYDANKLLKESRRLISAGGKAITQSNYVNGQPQNTEKAEYGNQMIEMGRYLRQRAEEATNGLFDSKYTKDQVSTMLKNAGANQATIDYVTDSNSLSDLIRKTSTFEQARQMDREMKTTPYRRNGVAGTGGKDIVNRFFNKSGLGEVVDLALTPVGKATGAATKGIGNLMTKAGNAYAAVDQYPGLTDQGATTVANAAARNASNLASQQSNDQYYFDQNPETAQAAAEQLEAQNGLGGMNTQLGAQNGLTSGMMASQGQQYEDPAKTQFVDTLNRLAAGMQNALNAGDIKAYEQIADIYSQYAKIYSVQSELNGWNAAEEAEDEKLTANQQKAQAAMQQLNQLASMQPDFGTAVSNVPILGNIVGMTGGNQYATQAAALEATLVNLLSGTSATESEREQIRRAYIPQFTDSDAVKQQKLQSAYQLIQNLYNSRNNWATQVDDYANGFFG